MTYQTQQFGHDAEEQAVSYLQENGYQILGRNFRAGRLGEIDIIARQADTLIFVEVRSRRTSSGGLAAESVSLTKLHKLQLAVSWYLTRTHAPDLPYRIDVIAFEKHSPSLPPKLVHYENVTL